jgi:hypothetical protein
VLDKAKAKLNGMPIFLTEGAMELRLGSMSYKYVKSTLAIRIILGNIGRSYKLRSRYGRAIQSTSTSTTIQRLTVTPQIFEE